MRRTLLALALPLLAAAPLRAQTSPAPAPASKAPAPASKAPAPASASAAPVQLLRPQRVEPLPGGLDPIRLINDNNPELIVAPGILLSTFAGKGRPVPEAHLDTPLQGAFDLFSHHVYAGRPDSLDSTLWLALVAAPRGDKPVQLRLLSGSTALSQSLDASQPAAPFLPLPALMRQESTPVWSGPGSRVATELLRRERSPLLPEAWTLPPGRTTTLVVLPLPVRGLDPLLNGRNTQLRLMADGPVDIASLAAFGDTTQPPGDEVWTRLLAGGLSPREHAPTPRGAPGRMIYSRVSGIQQGSTWRGRITDPGASSFSASRAPVSWPIASLERGRLGTDQVQTAPLQSFYPGTAWAAHGNYGVLYELSLPLRNDTARPLALQLALESPLKTDPPIGGLRFLASPGRSVMFRGSVEVSGLDGSSGRAAGRQAFHLVLRAGDPGPPLGRISLAPGEQRQIQVRLIYPADATPPQVLSLLPVVATGGHGGSVSTGSHGGSGSNGAASRGAGAPVKQSPEPPVAAP